MVKSMMARVMMMIMMMEDAEGYIYLFHTVHSSTHGAKLMIMMLLLLLFMLLLFKLLLFFILLLLMIIMLMLLLLMIMILDAEGCICATVHPSAPGNPSVIFCDVGSQTANY